MEKMTSSFWGEKSDDAPFHLTLFLRGWEIKSGFDNRLCCSWYAWLITGTFISVLQKIGNLNRELCTVKAKAKEFEIYGQKQKENLGFVGQIRYYF